MPDKGVRATVETVFDQLAMAMEEVVPREIFRSVYQAVDAWTQGVEGMASMAVAASDARGLEDRAARIRVILIDRFNLEHLRATMEKDDVLKVLPSENRAKLLEEINQRLSFDEPSLASPDLLQERIQKIRDRWKF